MANFTPLLLVGSQTESATITPSSEVATLPASRLKAQSPKRTWRSTTDAAQTLTLNWAEPVTLGGVALVNINSVGANAVFNNGGGGVGGGAMTMVNAQGLLPLSYFQLPTNATTDELVIDTTGNPGIGYHEIGRIHAGVAVAPNNVIDNNWTIQFEDPAQESPNANNEAPTLLKGEIRRVVTVTFVHVSEQDAMESFVYLGAVLGRTHDVFLVPRVDGDFPAWQAIHGLPTVGGVQRNTNRNDQWTVSVSVKEILSGGASVAAADNIVTPGSGGATDDPTATDFVI